MDAIARAEQVLSAAHARRPGACLPGSATSPADRLGTLVLAHDLIAECDARAREVAALHALAHPVRPPAAPTGTPGVDRTGETARTA